jgi:hypothetical protein
MAKPLGMQELLSSYQSVLAGAVDALGDVPDAWILAFAEFCTLHVAGYRASHDLDIGMLEMMPAAKELDILELEFTRQVALHPSGEYEGTMQVYSMWSFRLPPALIEDIDVQLVCCAGQQTPTEDASLSVATWREQALALPELKLLHGSTPLEHHAGVGGV